MDNLMKKDDREIKKDEKGTYGKKITINGDLKKVVEFREKISDEAYLDHAINKIATDLSHYLTK